MPEEESVTTGNLPSASEVTPITHFIGTEGNTSGGTKKYPIALIKNFINATNKTFDILQPPALSVVDFDDLGITVLRRIILGSSFTPDGEVQQIIANTVTTLLETIKLVNAVALTEVQLSGLVNLPMVPASSGFLVDACVLLETIDLSGITILVGGDEVDDGNPIVYNINGNPILATLTLSSLIKILGHLHITGNQSLQFPVDIIQEINQLTYQDSSGQISLNFAALTKAEFLDLGFFPNLTALTFGHNISPSTFTFRNCDTIAALDLSKILGDNPLSVNIGVQECPLLASINFSGLVVVNPQSSIGFTQLPELITLNLSNLQSVNNLSFSYLAKIVNLSLPALQEVNQFRINRCNLLQSVNISALLETVPAEDINISLNPVLTTITVPAQLHRRLLAGPGNNHVFSNNALSAATVNAILMAYDAGGDTGEAHDGYSAGSILLTGGTNAAPTGAGLTAKANLIAKNWSISTN